MRSPAGCMPPGGTKAHNGETGIINRNLKIHFKCSPNSGKKVTYYCSIFLSIQSEKRDGSKEKHGTILEQWLLFCREGSHRTQ